MAGQDEGLFKPFPLPDESSVLKGYNPVSETDSLYYEESGQREGDPVVFVHGGPGSRASERARTYFDPAYYRIILFDQRGCGRSTPSLCDPSTFAGHFLSHSIDECVEDMEKLRQHLQLERWHVLGGSWGATLALYYAQCHPHRVKSLILRGVFLCSAAEMDRYFTLPALESRFQEAGVAAHRALASYLASKGLALGDASDPYPLIRNFMTLSVGQDDRHAQSIWELFHQWMDEPTAENLAYLQDPASAPEIPPGARSHAVLQPIIVTAFHEQGLDLLAPHLLAKLASIPAIHVVHGLLDTVCPPEFTRLLEEGLQDLQIPASFHWIPNGKHTADSSPQMLHAFLQAIEAQKQQQK